MNQDTLTSTARELVAPAKGILAADESFSTIGKRLASIGVENTEENRRSYRDLLFSTPGVEAYISGVIMFEETLGQRTSEGKLFTEALTERGIIPGIKVDLGAKPLALHNNELVTSGLDGLRERLVGFREQGARFAKWRAVITIGDGIPSEACIVANAHALAHYAALCQEAEIVPIVEPEVLMDGGHDIDRCEQVTSRTLGEVFTALRRHDVLLEGILLKPNMVISGTESASQASISEVAERTMRCLLRNVPAAVPGIVFLSGGQDDVLATAHLNAMNGLHVDTPWELSFSYGRALQQGALKAWGGKPEQFAAGQKAFFQRAKANSAACSGRWDQGLEKTA
ncbi:Fructose-bisphosphate aldolase class I [Enhygromyxa salina]|uniref:Fructose-bisphosphate aldolase n=1 Tax=Enhygromyxa salina TaxID=215803 RepID=A0A0C2CZC0_9BACT|nr:class I fructose-bisphosphate aldolase [Enhygromyxa salina]KIG16316.1 Fructose-bisphosphate aldolase class I [Enhygromyxa salina]